ncbi:transglycosylase SLT domain-containing protein [Pigmentibacter ruber]|uniref:transglycosylase SLT domain-containing protein n=1 Tax=Pigmentibacter ruber TaxID=2683196 RepID=UPI00131CE667|nr:transglycosylase SLT domain-containing protein [Pigmentibacter ruber]
MVFVPEYFSSVPEGQAFHYVAKKREIPCHVLFLAAAGKVTSNNLPADERLLMLNFAKAACKTQNPDILWQIAHVESAFKIRIVNIAGKKTLTGDQAKKYLMNGISKNSNIDIGPLQINWRANGSKFKFEPINFLNGDFSVNFLSNNILKNYVSTCGTKWINCYHSYDKSRGTQYREKIDLSGVKLRKILLTYL